MLLLDTPSITAELGIEIRQRRPSRLPMAEEASSLGIRLTERSRIIRIRGLGRGPSTRQLQVLVNPGSETLEITSPGGEAFVEVWCLPGVTDTEGEMASRALGLSGIDGTYCRAGWRYYFLGELSAGRREAAENLLGNRLIHRFRWWDEPSDRDIDELETADQISPHQDIDLDGGDDRLLRLSHELHLALSLQEMRAIVAHFGRLDRSPTDIELQSIALSWSEHCSHKTLKAPVQMDRDGQTYSIDGLLRQYLVEPTRRLNRRWVRSAFVDNAGIIAFDADHDLSIKVETHNHPTALDPYGGAHTGIGGVIRDILGVSADPIAGMDVLCFGPPDLPAGALPEGAHHPSRTRREVIRGISDYGNQMGIPTVAGAVLYHSGYTANPLVFCGTVGMAPRDSHPQAAQPDDLVVLLGGRTGRDGIHGATMSSESLNRAPGASSAVQIGAPVTEKLLRDVIPRLRDALLYHAITDCGAGGLCSAVGEMGRTLGVDVHLERVPLKYQGLRAWEIWLSEAQERMVLAVPAECWPALHRICDFHEVEATIIGRFRSDGMMVLHHRDQVVADLSTEFLFSGAPRAVLQARWRTPKTIAAITGTRPAEGDLLALLAHPNIASKERIVRRYDHEVGARTVIGPLVGNDGPSDAAVLQPVTGSRRGLVLAHGINPLYGEIDPHAMSMLAIDEALRNLVAAGGSIDRTALLDNFCWGGVDTPEELGSLVRAVEGCRDGALAFGTPFICGKDSLRNVSDTSHGVHSIPGTLLITAVGVIPDVRKCLTSSLTRTGSRVYLLGATRNELGGSHYLQTRGVPGGTVPRVHPEESRNAMRAVYASNRRGLIRSCHDLSEGGLAVCASEMAIGGRAGLELDLQPAPGETDAIEALLFSETPGRFLIEASEEHSAELELLLAGTAHACIGRTIPERRLIITHADTPVLDIEIDELAAAWKGRASPATGGETIAEPEQILTRARPAARTTKAPRVLVLAAPGMNCDTETAEACRLAGARPEIVWLRNLVNGDARLEDFAMLVLPGGFSYGDHLGAGALLAATLRHTIMADLDAFVALGRPVLGICNGFQVLARLGMLGPISVIPNRDGEFECRWTPLRVLPSPSLFLGDLEQLSLPIAHGEGQVAIDPVDLPEVLSRAPLRYQVNPNGSVADVAGICNRAGNVLGLMPHPERAVAPRHGAGACGAMGIELFRNAVRYVREEL
ncbi:MAG: phosphoribosylformylglycinamidine synthase subunit PurL [Chloroflexota bacterium]